MEDVTPLNLEDQPKLFGLKYDQLIAILISLIVSSQFYSWCNPIEIAGQDFRLDIAIFLGILGPAYCLLTINGTSTNWDSLINFYFTSQVYIPGPDPSPTRFLIDEKLPQFNE
jgi:hypothetical protein